MRTESRRLLALLFACVGTVSCMQKEFIAPQAHELVIHAVLDPDVRNQYVFVQEALGTLATQTEVQGAAVSIETPTGQVLVADEVRDGTLFANKPGEPVTATAYRVSLDKYGISLVPGGTYRLTVKVGSRVATGSTTVPGYTTPPAPGPVQNLTRGKDTLSLQWTPVPYAAGYEISVSSSRGAYYMFGESGLTLPGDTRGFSGGSVFIAFIQNTVVVSAVDVNYYDYYRHSSDQYTGGGIISHLDGAIGVFGSVARIRTQLFQVY